MELFEIFPEGAEELGIQRSLSKAERDAIDDEDFAWPEEHKYPINTQAHLDAAAKLIGRAPEAEQAKIKARAIRIAKRKGFTLPESWQEDEGKDDKKEERAVSAAATPAANLSMYFPIVRTDADQWIVEGQATSEAIDSYGTIFEYESSKKAFQEWIKRGNIREQHDPRKAVGKALAVEFDDVNRAIYVRARISKGARDTWEKILDGTLSGFSIGVPGDAKVKYVERGNNKRVPMYYDHRLAELSVVDAPGSPNCDMRPVVRADGSFTDLIDDVTEEETTPEPAQPEQIERAGARVSTDTKSKMHTSIGHALHSVVGQMQNCGCEDCSAAMKMIDPDNDGDIDLGGYDDPDHDWQELYNQSSNDEEMERKISGMIERALQPVFARFQGIAGTLARVNGGASLHTSTPSIETIVSGAITRAVEAATTAHASSLTEVRADLSAVKEQVGRIADTPMPGAPIMNAGAMPRPTVEKRLATDPYQAHPRSGSSVYDALARMSEAGMLDTPERQADAIAAGYIAQRRG
jgi:phage head maturation protease